MNADDEAIAAVRDADPARGRSTDLTSLRSAVDRRTGDGATTTTATHDELADRRAQRSRRRTWVAGIAASVLVGVAGFAAGVTTAGNGTGGEDSADSAAGAAEPGVELDSDDQMQGSAGEVAAEESAGAGVEQADAMWASTRAVFVASGLPDDAGTAEAFGYDPTGVASADTAAQMAQALGVEGDVVDHDGYWMVGDPAGRNLAVYDDGTASLSYSDPALDPWACAVDVTADSDPDGADGGGSDGFSGCETDAAAPADPVATATDFLVTLGVDVEPLELVVDYSEGGAAGVSAYTADADRSFGGQWNLTVSSEGVYSAWGWLAPRTSLGSYDVISATDAVERLMDPRFGASNGLMPLAAAEGVESGVTGSEAAGDTAVSSEPQAPRGPVEPIEPGETIPWPVTTYTIVAAELTLGTYTLSDGAVVLLPTWSLTAADDGGTWTVVAVTDDSLAFDAS